jgi:uncharacterized protein YecE (DUF72 family)
MGSDIRIGISGWRYKPWRGEFYPEDLVQRRELEFASRAVNSIEINGSFYALQRPERYAEWASHTPDDFVFSVKGPRYITHTRRLREVEEPLANFFASGPLHLGDKLGPLLWQFPASFKPDHERFARFFDLLPHDARAAAKLAAHCAERLRTPGYLDFDGNPRLRHAVEIRNPDGLDDAFVELLRQHQIALVVADTAGKWPYCEEITSDFLYLRLHGDKKLYTSGYSAAALDRWEQRIRAWTSGGQPDDAHRLTPKARVPRKARDLYCYFDNDVKVRAPFDARALLDRLGLSGSLQARPGEALEESIQTSTDERKGAMQ